MTRPSPTDGPDEPSYSPPSPTWNGPSYSPASPSYSADPDPGHRTEAQELEDLSVRLGICCTAIVEVPHALPAAAGAAGRSFNTPVFVVGTLGFLQPPTNPECAEHGCKLAVWCYSGKCRVGVTQIGPEPSNDDYDLMRPAPLGCWVDAGAYEDGCHQRHTTDHAACMHSHRYLRCVRCDRPATAEREPVGAGVGQWTLTADCYCAEDEVGASPTASCGSDTLSGRFITKLAVVDAASGARQQPLFLNRSHKHRCLARRSCIQKQQTTEARRLRRRLRSMLATVRTAAESADESAAGYDADYATPRVVLEDMALLLKAASEQLEQYSGASAE
jgi:hypothetical protein